MSRGEIISHIADANYNVKIFHNPERMAAELAAAQKARDDFDAEGLADAKTVKADAEVVVIDAVVALNAAITVYIAQPLDAKIPEPVIEATTVVIDARVLRDIACAKVDDFESKLNLLDKNLEKFTDLDAASEETTTAWCVYLADRDPGQAATGIWFGHDLLIPDGTEVALLEVAHHGVNIPSIILRPWEPKTDSQTEGEFLPILAMNPYACLFDACVNPGMASWQARYRFGIITGSDEDSLAEVELDEPEQ